MAPGLQLRCEFVFGRVLCRQKVQTDFLQTQLASPPPAAPPAALGAAAAADLRAFGLGKKSFQYLLHLGTAGRLGPRSCCVRPRAAESRSWPAAAARGARGAPGAFRQLSPGHEVARKLAKRPAEEEKSPRGGGVRSFEPAGALVSAPLAFSRAVQQPKSPRARLCV